MKRIHIVAFITTCIIFSFLLFGCGGSGPGMPGSCNTEKTGVDARVTSVSHSDPAGNTGELWFIDLYQSDCDGVPEDWGDDYANITFEGLPIYDPLIDNTLFITDYRVTFDRLSPDYPPVDEIGGSTQGSYSITPFETTVAFPFLIFDFGMKLDLQDLIARGVYTDHFPYKYNMSIQLWGQDRYGQEFCIGPIIRLIEVAPYDNC